MKNFLFRSHDLFCDRVKHSCSVLVYFGDKVICCHASVCHTLQVFVNIGIPIQYVFDKHYLRLFASFQNVLGCGSCAYTLHILKGSGNQVCTCCIVGFQVFFFCQEIKKLFALVNMFAVFVDKFGDTAAV